MSVIWKFEIPAQPSFVLVLREAASVLSIQMQRGKPMLWALVDTAQPERDVGFVVVPTGQEFNAAGLRFHGTFQPDLSLVFHVFSRGL